MARKHVDIRITKNFELRDLLSTNPAYRRALDNEIRSILMEARETAIFRVSPAMFDSTHETYRAIRTIVYKRVIGGEMNILNVRRALRQGSVAPSSRGRMPDTTRILSYSGIDRGFVFRFVNDGTKHRWTTHMDGHEMYRKSVSERPKNRHYRFPNRLGGRGGAAENRRGTINIFQRKVEPIMYGDVYTSFEQAVNSIIDKQLNK